jgi:hypothetical protein
VPPTDGAELRRAAMPEGSLLMRRGLSIPLAAAFTLSACATPAQMHTEAQLNDVALGCGLTLGELIQDESEKKLLLLIHQNPTAEQQTCVVKWGRANGLKPVFVNMSFPEG